MKKIGKSRFDKLPPIRIYNSDILKIFDLLNEGCKSVQIKVCGYQINEQEDINKIETEATNELEITGFDPYVSFSCTPTSARVSVLEDSYHAVGLLEKIKEHLKQRKKPLAWLTHNTGLPFITSAVVFVFLSLSTPSAGSNLLQQAIILCTLISVWITAATYLKNYKYSEIILDPNQQKIGFLKRKKDDILLMILSCAFGAATTLLLTKLSE